MGVELSETLVLVVRGEVKLLLLLVKSLPEAESRNARVGVSGLASIHSLPDSPPGPEIGPAARVEWNSGSVVVQ